MEALKETLHSMDRDLQDLHVEAIVLLAAVLVGLVGQLVRLLGGSQLASSCTRYPDQAPLAIGQPSLCCSWWCWSHKDSFNSMSRDFVCRWRGAVSKPRIRMLYLYLLSSLCRALCLNAFVLLPLFPGLLYFFVVQLFVSAYGEVFRWHIETASE